MTRKAFFISIAAILSFHLTSSADTCTEEARKDITNKDIAFENACNAANISGDCKGQIVDRCSKAEDDISCDAERIKYCGVSRDEARQIRNDLKDEVNRGQERADDKKENSADVMGKVMEQLEKKTEANKSFLETKRDIESRQVEGHEEFQKQLTELRKRSAERLRDTNQQVIDLGREGINIAETKIAAAKEVRNSILQVQAQCRQVVRSFERNIGAEIRASQAANRSNQAGSQSVAANLNAGTISGIGALKQKIREQRDAEFRQCMSDGEDAIAEARKVQVDIDRLATERNQKLEEARQNVLQFKQNSDQADQQEIAQAQQTLIQKDQLAQNQIADAEKARQDAIQNADIGLGLAMAGLGGGGGLGGGEGIKEGAEEADRQFKEDRACLRKMKSRAPANSDKIKAIMDAYKAQLDARGKCPDSNSFDTTSEALQN